MNDDRKYSRIGHATTLELGSWTKSRKNPINEGPGYVEIEWGTTVRVGDAWIMLTPAWFDGGMTPVWIGR